MARRIESRLKINCALIARTPLHVGGMDGSVDTDLALAVNGQGDFYIPGTSLAGALRGWLLAGADEARRKGIEHLWGYQKRAEGQASYVFIEDATVCAPDGQKILLAEIRDGVGIDRVTGAAANQIKFDRAIIPRGARISFEMFVELAADEPDPKNPGNKFDKSRKRDLARSLTREVLQALQDGAIRFGAAKSRGLGRVEVADLKICEQGLKGKEALLKTLRGHGEEKNLDDLKKAGGNIEAPRLMMEIAWQPRGPLMVKAERDGLAVDMLPLVSAIDGQLSFVLPGSSIKGAFRSQAERIVRTLLGLVDGKPVTKKRDFIKQIEIKEATQNAASPVGWLFGVAGAPGKEDEDDLSPLPGFSALTVDDCYAELTFNPTDWSAIEQARNEEELHDKLEQAGLGAAQQAFHVAIDRWLCSAADGFLYSVLEPHGVSWEPIRLTLDLARLPDEERQCCVALWLLALRDFVAGRTPLGFGTNRGMGAVEVTGINVTASGCETHSWVKEVEKLAVTDNRLTIPETLRQQLNPGWQNRFPLRKESV